MKKERTGVISLLRWMLILIMCILPAAAYSADNDIPTIEPAGMGGVSVELKRSITPNDCYATMDNYIVVMQNADYTISYGFTVTTSKTPKSVQATYSFGSRKGNLSANVVDGAITIQPIRFRSLPVGDYQFSYSINCTYTDGTEDSRTGGDGETVRIMTGATASVEKTEYDAVLSGTNVTLGPITMSGGYDGGWNVAWSAGSPSGTNKNTCVYRSTATEYTVNTVTATVTNTMGGQTLYSNTITFSVPTYGTPSASITGAPQATFAGSKMSLHVATTGGYPEGWHYEWTSGGSDSPDYTFTVPSVSSSSSTGTTRVKVTNNSPQGAEWFSNNIGVNYKVYPQPSVQFTEVSNTIIAPGTKVPLQMNASGGDTSKWIYEWYVNDSKVSSASAYSYVAPSISGAAVQTVKAVAKNNPSDVSEPYEVTREYRFIVIAGGGSGSTDIQKYGTYSGTPVNLHVDLGSVEDGWKYVWWITALGQQEGNLPSTTNDLSFDRTVTSTETFNITCRVSKNIDGQNVEVDFFFEVTVYPTPSMEVVYEPNYSSYIPGESFTATINVSGGDPNTWEYEWTRYTGGEFIKISSQKTWNEVIPAYNATDYESDYDNYKTRYLRGSARNYPPDTEYFWMNKDKRYSVYPSPQFSVEKSVFNVISGSDVELKTITSGGAGWTYSWTENGTALSSQTGATASVKPMNEGNQMITKTYAVHAECWLPNGEGRRIVDTKDYTFTVNVYPKTTAQFAQEYTNYTFTATDIRMSIKLADNNPANWNIKWYVNNNLDTSITGTNYTFSSVTPGTYNVRANITNKNESSMSFDLSHSFTVYAKPSFTSTPVITVLSGTPVVLNVDTQGGCPDGWHYKWLDNNNNIVGTDSPELSVTPVNTGNSVIYEKYTVELWNNFPDNTEAFRNSSTIGLTVYPESTLRFAEDYASEILVNENVAMSIKLADGDASNWRIRWFIDDVSISYATGTSYTFKQSTPGTYKVKVVITNTSNSELVFSIEHEFTVCATPSVTVSKDTYYILSGTAVNLSVNAQGGGQWHYKWTDESGATIGTDADNVNVTPVNNSTAAVTKEYTVELWNTLSGNREVYRNTQKFYVHVYPTSTASFDESYPDEVLVNTEVPMTVVLADGDASNWRFRWFNNDASVSYATNATYNFRQSTPGTYNIKAVVTNKNNSELEFELNHTFNVYAEPALVNPNPTFEKSLYTGDALSFTESVTGGFPNGWTWRVEQNGTQVNNGTGTEAKYTFVGPNVSTRTVYDLSFEFTNTSAPDKVLTLTKVLTVYPQPNANVEITSGSEIMGPSSSVSYKISTNDAPGSWSYTWSLDGKLVAQTSDYTYTSPANVSQMETHELVATAFLKVGDANLDRNFEFTRKIEVWPSGVISSNEVQNCGTLTGNAFTVGVNVIGELSGWTFTWTRNGQTFTNPNPSYTVNYTEADVNKTDVFTVHAVYTRNSVVTFDRVYTINVTVYPTPSVSILHTAQENYINSTLYNRVTFTGGNPDGWSAEWIIYGTEYNAPEVEFLAGGAPGATLTNVVTVINRDRDGNEIYSTEIPFTVTSYDTGEAMPVPLQYTDYAGSCGKLEINTTGGYPNGWSFRWYGDGFNEVAGNTFEPPIVNNGNDVMKAEVYVEVTNTLNGTTGFSQTFVYEYQLWPAIHVPEAPTASAHNIRQGDAVLISIEATGGSGKWNYSWYEDGKSLGWGGSYINRITVPYPASEKSIQENTYSVKASNNGPQKQTWYDAMTGGVTISSYAAPSAPAEVRIKGNGTSRTLIVMMSETNQQLEARGYQYVFGYTDNTGDHALAPTANRYNHFTEQQFSAARNNFWAYCQWVYSDGSVVTSGKRYLSGYLETSFDASVYAGGRGDSAGIDRIEAGTLESNGYSFRAEPASPAEAHVTVYSTAGLTVRMLHYPEQSSFDERVDLEGLANGFYIVEVRVGDLRTVKKVIVDNK